MMKVSFLAVMVAGVAIAAQLPEVERSLTGTKVRATALLVHPDELTDTWVDRAARLGVSTLAIHPTGGKSAARSLEDLLARCRTPEFRRLVDRAWEAGLKVEYEAHAAGWLLPRTLFAEHPEYFRENGKGVRTNDLNFCVSSPEAMKIVEERARLLARGLYRSTPRFFLWLDDAKDAECHCERCRAYSASDQQLLVLNRLQAALREEKPGAKMAYLAYFGTMPPPERVKPSEGIFLEYAPIKRVWKRPASDQPQAVKPEELNALLDFFGRKDARVLEYWFDNSLFSRWKKPEKNFKLNADVFAADVAWYAEKGFGEIASFACFLGPGYERQWGAPDVSAAAAGHAVNVKGLYPSQGGRDATVVDVRLDSAGKFSFAFSVKDATPTRIVDFKSEADVDEVDRVELYLSPTADLSKPYYCLEITPDGQVHDYAGRSYRQLDAAWKCRTLKTVCRRTAEGYEVSGTVDWAELEGLGFTRANLHLGVYRADFREGAQLVDWLSALPPGDNPDFHKAGTLFRFWQDN